MVPRKPSQDPQAAICSPKNGLSLTSNPRPVVPAGERPELRVVLLGRSGAGRSATGNTLLCQELFESRLASQPVTTTCAKGRRDWGEWSVVVMDTPAIVGGSHARCCREIARCALLSAPGPHALLLVTQLGRFTQEDEAAVQQVWRLFGSGAAGRTVVVFTRGDELRGGSLLRYVQDTGTYALQKLLRDCGQRCCAFDNRATGKQKEEQVGELLAIVLEMLGGDLNNYYRNGLYDRAEQLMERPDIDFEKKCDLLAEDVEKQLLCQRSIALTINKFFCMLVQNFLCSVFRPLLLVLLLHSTEKSLGSSPRCWSS
uniref:AIG1-type G domain-containing protein n=1 Tax=Coturnix japonica TaxID=93934 RepID=A0A8C2Y932_COTJA